MREIWTATIEVLTAPSESGDTKAFTNVVAWASDPDEYGDVVKRVLNGYGLAVIGIDECQPISSCDQIAEELAGQIERARKNPNACIYSTLHYYPSKPS
jgi:ABC-type phosphate transport system substrate-binding protein